MPIIADNWTLKDTRPSSTISLHRTILPYGQGRREFARVHHGGFPQIRDPTSSISYGEQDCKPKLRATVRNSVMTASYTIISLVGTRLHDHKLLWLGLSDLSLKALYSVDP